MDKSILVRGFLMIPVGLPAGTSGWSGAGMGAIAPARTLKFQGLEV